MFRVECIGCNVGRHQKYVGDIVGTEVENVSNVFEPRVIWKHRKDIKGCWKGKKCLYNNKNHQKRHHVC
jgi:hypothetical protein